MTYKEYQEKLSTRCRIISDNKSRRFKGLPALPVPEKPVCPQVRVAYDAGTGDYVGRLAEGDPVPAGSVIRMENALY